MWIVFFFKQKTAYDMRISDCSSDVCSSDLSLAIALHALVAQRLLAAFELLEQRRSHRQCDGDGEHVDDREMRESGRHRRVDIRVFRHVGGEQDVRGAGQRRAAGGHRDHGDRKSTRLQSSHYCAPRMPSSALKKNKKK